MNTSVFKNERSRTPSVIKTLLLYVSFLVTLKAIELFYVIVRVTAQGCSQYVCSGVVFTPPPIDLFN